MRYTINLCEYELWYPRPAGDPNIIIRLGRDYNTMKDVIDMWYEQVRQEEQSIQAELWALFGTTLYEGFRVDYGT